ncbi:MAG: HD domain-containing protein [Phycisphaerae bacterium]
MNDRFEKQIAFVREIDKVKEVFRQTYLLDKSRKENDAEHSWHLAMMAILLAEYASAEVDLLKVLRMVLLHDLVEIDAGDTFAYDEQAYKDKDEREKKAADRIFGMLPGEQAHQFRELWDEFEGRTSCEAKFAAALDRLQPLMHNYFTQGAAWREHDVPASLVRKRNAHISEGAPKLWEFAEYIIDDSVQKGYLRDA